MYAGPLAGMAHNLSDEASDGRYRSDLVTTARTKPAATRAFVVDGARVATGAAPAFDDRFPDVPAADPDHRLAHQESDRRTPAQHLLQPARRRRRKRVLQPASF